MNQKEDSTMCEYNYLFELPVAHIYEDGSVNIIYVKAWEPDENDVSPSIEPVIEQGDHMITFGSTEHVRALARALLIAADLCDERAGKPTP